MDNNVFKNKKLIDDCLKNSARAQMQLYDMYCDAMFVIAQRYVKDEHIAEDIMQDAFIKVFKNINQYKGEVTLGAWIKKIIINQCIDFLKKKKLELISIEDREYSLVIDDDWYVEDTTTVEKVTEIINQLPEKYKIILNLYLLEGYDHQEIAQVLNITEVASRTQLMRGKKKLINKLKTFNYA